MVGLKLLVVAVGICLVQADMYLHNPRGSNNRLNENGRQRRNANRMFDSQNNNRGGYNVGNLYYYAGSKLPIQWTNQHSCAGPNNNCEIIIQYMCGDLVRDGITTRTIPDNKDRCYNKDCNKDLNYGMHEDFDYYNKCKDRERNKGLFTADQKLKADSARYTRQNPGGTRRGYECPEERDYYPYWHPAPWKDIVVMTNDVSRCNYYKQESQNVKSKFACVELPDSYLYIIRGNRKRRKRNIYVPNNKASCQAAGGKWKEFPAHNLPAPDCIKSMWSRDNHNGNNVGGYMNTYNWTVPDVQENACVMRIRYNISTNDYDSWNTFADKNGDDKTKIDIASLVGLSPDVATKRGYVFKNNPQVQLFSGTDRLKLQLAINTAQYGRTFQDRSHVFEIRKSPSELKGKNVYNLNVRGKRGNIVQVYPAVEYDFVPNTLSINSGDYVHFQWTGSNTNPGNNAGQGRRGTDRSNVILLRKQVYPEGKPKSSSIHGHFGANFPMNLKDDAFLGLGMEDTKKLAFIQLGAGDELDNAGTYFDLGPRKVTSAGVYYYMCTRNNNFSNRSQKGKIIVKGNGKTKKEEIQGEIKEEVAIENTGQWSNRVTLANSKRGQSQMKDHDVDTKAWQTEKEGSNKQDGGEGQNEEKGLEDDLQNQAWITSTEEDTSNIHNGVRVEYLTKDAGEKMLQQSGASPQKTKDAYASDYMAVYPMKNFPDPDSHISMELKLKSDSDPEYVTVYHSLDMNNWYPVENQDIQNGQALVKVKAGGLYVARERQNSEDALLDKSGPEYERFFDEQKVLK
eukprot:gene9192-10166_t